MILSQLKASQWSKTLKFSSERKNGSTSFVTLLFTVSFFCDVLFTTVAFFTVWSCSFGLPSWRVLKDLLPLGRDRVKPAD